MVEKFGSDQQQIATLGGGVISEDGATLLSGESLGESALLFGPAALREIKAGIANGDFAIAPADDTATITADNPLPYWTFTDVNSAGAITAALVADAGAGSGNVLRFTVASGTLTGKSATISRFIPVASSASRSFSFYAEATFENGTNSTQANAKITCQFYKSDQATTTGTAFESDLYTFDFLQLPTGATAPDLYVGTPDLADTTAPADAAFLKVTITIATVATQSADRTVDLTEVRVGSGLPELILTDKSGGGWPAYIINNNDTLSLYSSSQSGVLDLGDATNLTGLTSVDIYSGDLMNITTGATGLYINSGNAVDITAPSGVSINNTGLGDGTLRVNTIDSEATTASDLLFQATGSDFIFQDMNSNGTNPRLLFRDRTGTYYAGLKSGAANVVQVLNGTSATDYAQIWAERIYPMNGSTASRYMYDDGTRIAFSSGIDAAGTVVCSGAMISDAISTTTQTSSAAIWVLSSGTTYSLRRNSSSARYKTNIVDADAAVLEAARKIKPRHYESTISDESGATRLGFIAEEVEAAGLTHAVGYDAEGRVESLDSVALIAALFARVNDLEERLKALEG
jgi:hypothetical protein